VLYVALFSMHVTFCAAAVRGALVRHQGKRLAMQWNSALVARDTNRSDEGPAAFETLPPGGRGQGFA
jgi:hypothetical protein